MPTWTLKIGGSAIDPEAKRVTVRRLRVDSRVADTLSFSELTNHFDGTWAEGAAVVLEYPTGTVRFTGRIAEKNAVGSPGAEAVEYTAVGWRALAQNVQVSRSATDTYPERLYNAANDDIDKAYRAAGPSVTVGAILQDLFDTFLTSLRSEGACHPSATPYVSGELALLTFVPGKIVLSGMTFDQAVVAVLAEQGPAWSCWIDSTGVWHFFDRTTQSATTVAMGAGGAITSNQLRRHVRGRHTAVKVVGKRGRGQEVWPKVVGFGTDEFGVAITGLTKSWNTALESTWTLRKGEGIRDSGAVSSVVSSTVIEISGKNWPGGTDWTNGFAVFPRISLTTAFTIASTAGTNRIELVNPLSGVNVGDPVVLFKLDDYGDVFRLFQVTDPAFRDFVMEGASQVDCCPHILAIIRNEDGEVVGTQQVSVRLEGDGKVRAMFPLLGRGSHPTRAGESTVATDVKFVFCYRPAGTTTPILARYPTSGYSGGASGAPWSIQRELTVAVEEFVDASATSAYVTLATEVHKATSLVGTSGRVALSGIDWTWVDPRRRVHISHASDTTGWEALGAQLTTAQFDFERDATELELSDDGSSDGVNYQSMLDQIRQRMKAGAASVETKKLGDFVNCRGEERKRGGYDDGTYGPVNASERSTETISAPTYIMPRPFPYDDVSTRACKCDKEVMACETKDQTEAMAREKPQWVCFPDDRHGIVLKHPGDGVDPITGVAKNYCAASQLAFRHTGSTIVAGGNYYPFACEGVAIGAAPDGVWQLGGPTTVPNGTCASGWRTLVVVESADIDDGATGTEIGVGDFLVQFLTAYDNYMQHNEEAHCCLDTRLICLDEALFINSGGGPGSCPTKCRTPAWKAIEDLFGITQSLYKCIMSIHYAEGSRQAICPPPQAHWDTAGCGAC